MKRSQTSTGNERIKRFGKRAKVIVISDSDSDDGKTHSPVLTVDQIEQNEVKFIQNGVDQVVEEDQNDSKF